MDFSSLLFSMKGRINRAQWWTGIIIVWIVWCVLVFALFKMFGIDVMTARLSTAGTLAIIIALALIAYPVTVLMIKRLKDRGRTPLLALAYWLPIVIGIKLQVLGLTASPTGLDGESVMTLTATGWLINFTAMAVSVWLIIELGLLKGTEGPNSHGPDPLASTATLNLNRP